MIGFLTPLSEWITPTKVVALVAAAAGVAARSLWDAAIKRREAVEDLRLKSRITRLEQQLSEFYWPIYLRLQQNEVIWERILHREATDQATRQLGRAIEQHVVIPVHDDIVARLQRGAHLADADYAFRKLIADYLQHVSVYKALRTAGDDRLPAQLGAPWPQQFNREFERRTLELQREYDQRLGRARLADPTAPSMFRDLEREAEEQLHASGLKPRE